MPAGRSSPSATASCTAAERYAAPIVRVDAADIEALARLHPARAAAPAAQSRRHPRAGRAPARRAAGGLLRHRLPPHAARRGAAASPCRAGSPSRASAATASTASPTNTSPRVLPQHLDANADGRVVVAHLGNGASHVRACATAAASPPRWASPRSTACMMGTRCGAHRPGRAAASDGSPGHGRGGPDAAALQGVRPARRLRHQPATCARCSRSHAPEARRGGRPLLLPHRPRDSARWRPRSAGSMRWCSPPASASMPRRCATASAARLGLARRAAGRRRQRPPRPRITTPDSGADVLVLPTNEELMIAQHTAALVA